MLPNEPLPEVEADIVFVDDFNRPDSSEVGNGWEVLTGSYGIAGNELQPSLAPNVTQIILRDIGVQDNISIEAGVFVPSTSEGVLFRAKDNRDHLIVQFEPGIVTVYARTDNSKQKIAGVSLDIVRFQVYKLRVELRGSEIKVFVDDELIIIANDTRHMEYTKVGFQAWTQTSTIGKFDSFSVVKL